MAKLRAWIESHPEEVKERGRLRAQRHWQDKKDDPNFKAQRNAAKQRYREKLKTEVVAAYGGGCGCCVNTLSVHLTVDHVKGDGATDTAHGEALYRRIKAEGFPSRYQVLCWNCNSAKHILGRCPCGEAQ